MRERCGRCVLRNPPRPDPDRPGRPRACKRELTRRQGKLVSRWNGKHACWATLQSGLVPGKINLEFVGQSSGLTVQARWKPFQGSSEHSCSWLAEQARTGRPE